MSHFQAYDKNYGQLLARISDAKAKIAALAEEIRTKQHKVAQL